jgi:Spy/CpxP family protein refolding chaperone
MKRITILAAILLFVAGMTAPAMAQSGHGFKGHPGGHGCGQFAGKGCGGGQCNILGCKDKLELTDDQVAMIKEINFKHQSGMIDLKAELKKAELNMKQVAHADNPGKSDVLAASKQVHGVEGKITEAQINHKFALKAVLTAEQLEKWKKCQAECGGKCSGSCGGRCGGKCGHGAAGIQCKPGCTAHSGVPCDPAKCSGHGPGKHAPGCPQGK